MKGEWIYQQERWLIENILASVRLPVFLATQLSSTGLTVMSLERHTGR